MILGCYNLKNKFDEALAPTYLQHTGYTRKNLETDSKLPFYWLFETLFSQKKIFCRCAIYKHLIFAILVIFCQNEIVAEKKHKGKIFIGNFSSYKSQSIPEMQSKIYSEFERFFLKKGIQIEKLGDYESIESEFQKVKGQDAVIIAGYYKKIKDQNLSVYGQVYNPDSGYLIDALNITFELFVLFLGRKFDVTINAISRLNCIEG